MPNAPAIKDAIKIPSKMAIDLIKPLAKALIAKMITIVKKPIARLAGTPKAFAVAEPPPRF